MPKFLITAVVGDKYEKVVEADSLEDAQNMARHASPTEDEGWDETEVDTWTDVEEIEEEDEDAK